MSTTYQIVRGIIILVFLTVTLGWFVWRWLKNSRDPALLIFRWVLTALALGGLYYGAMEAREAEQRNDASALLAVIYALVGGMFLAIVWVPAIVDYVSRKIGSLYDGGDTEVDPKPFFSIFNSKRSQGKYSAALAEIRRQLDKFPTDFEGLMLLAALQAENLNDLPGADITIQRICNQPCHAPPNISAALNQLADWHLNVGKDREAARQALEKIIALLPDTEMSLKAAQRIARLAKTEMLLAPHQRERMVVEKGVDNLGLLREQEHLKPVETDPAKVAAEYVRHLEQHPLDTLAREKLAMLYANHYHRLDMALGELEQLARQPNHPPKQVVHWLNLMADLQIQEGAEYDSVRATLQRIIDQFPELAAAENARRRMDSLKLELKAKSTGRQVRLGVYEQNLGLKRTG
jgi:tetratricopeptide (TPR) repeat protein